MKFKSRQKGFVSTVILIIIALLILKYVFNVNFQNILNSTVVQDIWSIVKQLFTLLWQSVLLTIDFLKVVLGYLKDFVTSLKTK